jgi:hypothetical protein
VLWVMFWGVCCLRTQECAKFVDADCFIDWLKLWPVLSCTPVCGGLVFSWFRILCSRVLPLFPVGVVVSV